jgi:hypothetical protein
MNTQPAATDFLLTFANAVANYLPVGALVIWPELTDLIGESGCDLLRSAVRSRGMQLVDNGAGCFFLAA